jgi:hypothetical protein
MDSIIRLDAKGQIVIEPAAAKLFPELSKLSTNSIRYLVLAYDASNTLFKQQPYREWKALACQAVFLHKNVSKVEGSAEILPVLDLFQKLVYDEDRIQKAKILQRKRELQDEILTVKGSAPMKSIAESINMLEKMITDLDARITQSDEEVILANKNGSLSMIEKWQRKMKLVNQ